MTVKVWRYSEPNGKAHEGWYVAFIDEIGFVSIQSDWGDYAYCWSCRGEGVGTREFLIDCDDSYLLGKFSPRAVVDERATRAAILEAIGVDGDEDETDRLLEADLSSDVGVADWLRETELKEAHELIRMQTHPQAVAFMQRVWPRLMTKVRSDLDAEAPKAGAVG